MTVTLSHALEVLYRRVLIHTVDTSDSCVSARWREGTVSCYANNCNVNLFVTGSSPRILMHHHKMMSPDKKSKPLTESVVISVQEEPDDFVLLKEENRKAAECHIVRKLDMRLMPTVVFIFLMNYIDVSCSSIMIWR